MDFTFQCCARCMYNSLYGNRTTAECHCSPNMVEGQFPELPASEWCGDYKEGTSYQIAGIVKA